MKCPNCGAEIGDNKYCQYCGSQVTAEMKREQELVNKEGCPKCGSTNIEFKRENHGEIRGKNAKQIVHRTVGYCKDCGYTWYPTDNTTPPKKRKTWLWVLGWIFIFPVPLTILMLRKKDMKPALKYGIIAAGWLVYLLIGLGGNGNSSSTPKDTAVATSTPTPEIVETAKSEPTPSATVTEEKTEASTEKELSKEEQDAAIKKLLETTMSSSDVFEYEIDLSDENVALVKIWKDGIASDLALAVNGNQAAIDAWNQMKSSMITMNMSLQDLVQTVDKDRVVSVMLLNDANLNNTLLTTIGGAVLNDALND